jgi:hypothetical protein
MKRLRILSAFMVLFTAIGFMSCDVEPLDPALLDNLPVAPVGPASFKVDFSGSTHTAIAQQAMITSNTIMISGVLATNGESVTILVQGTTVGTYTGDDILITYLPSAMSTGAFINENLVSEEISGTVNITGINTTTKTITGTFSFTGYYSDEEQNLPSVAFSNGVFNSVPYTGTTGPGTDPDPIDEPYFTAIVDGTAVDYSEDTTAITSTIDGQVYTNLIGASTTDLESITLNLHGIEDPGTYDITSSFLADANASYNSAEGESYNAESGILTIISNENGWIVGTFSFSGVNGETDEVIQVTEGKFKIEN